MAAAIAQDIRSALPGTEEILVTYLAGYVVDGAAEEEDTLLITRQILESSAEGREDALERLLSRLSSILEARRNAGAFFKAPKLQRLDRALDMSRTGALSSTIQFAEGVDLESINKTK